MSIRLLCAFTGVVLNAFIPLESRGQQSIEGTGAPLEPYILIGESGKSIERTSKDIIGRLFMRNFEILGKYSPADDPDRYVIVVTNRDLLKVVDSDDNSALLVAAMRIAITRAGELTYVSCQNPEYWANAYLRHSYPSAAQHIIKFKRDVLKAMPPMRGRFNRPYGGSSTRPLSPAALREYRYRRRTASLDDIVTLATFSSFEAAITAIERGLDASEHVSKVFEKRISGRPMKLYGLALGSVSGERRIFALLDNSDMKRTAGLPYEIIVSGNQVLMLPVRYRLPLSFPDLDRKTYRQLKILDEEINQLLSSLFE